MKPLKVKLLVIAVVMLVASSTFGSFITYHIGIDTSSLLDQAGYLYFAYGGNNGVDSIATLHNFTSDGSLDLLPSESTPGSDVTGSLQDLPLVFKNTAGTNDYNQGFKFGKFLNFLVDLDYALPGYNSFFAGAQGGNSTLSLGFYATESGSNSDGTPSGDTLLALNLYNDGTSDTFAEPGVSFLHPDPPTSVPEAASLLLWGCGFAGVVFMKRRSAKA